MQTPSIEIISNPVVEPVSLTDTKNYLKVDNTNDDSLISSLIKTAREMAEKFLGKSLITQTLKMSFDDYCSSKISLLRFPVQSISSVKIIDKNDNETTIDNSLYYLNSGNKNLCFETSLIGHKIEIIYVCGYGDNASDIPESIRQGMLIHIAQIYDGRTGINAMPSQVKELYASNKAINF